MEFSIVFYVFNTFWLCSFFLSFFLLLLLSFTHHNQSIQLLPTQSPNYYYSPSIYFSLPN